MPDEMHDILATLPADTLRWLLYLQPNQRSVCRQSVRPCPHILCRYHLPTEEKDNAPPSSQPSCQLDLEEAAALAAQQPIEADQAVGLSKSLHSWLLQFLNETTPPHENQG